METKTLLTALQMMPGGMMPSGWDWGSMWLVMVIPAIAIVGGILLVVFLVLRNERQPGPIQAATYSYTQTQPTLTVPSATIQGKYSGTNNETVGKVVLSLAPTLTGDERRVMDELAKAGGEMLQSTLPEMTDYSKATISKHRADRLNQKWAQIPRCGCFLCDRTQLSPWKQFPSVSGWIWRASEPQVQTWSSAHSSGR